MQNADVARTRSFALIGHAADGKTSLAEALLRAAGVTALTGSVAEGTSVLDNTPECREQTIAVNKLQEAMFWANAAVARNHEHYAEDSSD